ncbi:MAG: hypothetical protein LBP52_04855 [Burkholderiaceae bacterium]|nr:hypothetical protein [Burkholderiaceae bacterium]
MTAAMACAAWGTAPAHAAISITETDADSFRYATAPNWTLLGTGTAFSGVAWTPHLTANPAGTDPAGAGWLRLTENVNLQAGTAVYNTAFSRAEGLQIIFDYVAYGHSSSEDADGIAFYLIDGSTVSPTLGSYSGSLGYVGVTKGYVGVGLDEWDNCASPPCNPSPSQNQRVVVWGAAPSFPFLISPIYLSGTALGQISTTQSDRSDARTVRITISPASSALPPTVTVEINPNDGVTGFVKVIDALSLAGNGPVPATFKLGISASTGGANNIHEVRIRSAKTLVSAVPTLGESTLGALAVLLALLTLPALRRRFKN